MLVSVGPTSEDQCRFRFHRDWKTVPRRLFWRVRQSLHPSALSAVRAGPEGARFPRDYAQADRPLNTSPTEGRPQRGRVTVEPIQPQSRTPRTQPRRVYHFSRRSTHHRPLMVYELSCCQAPTRASYFARSDIFWCLWAWFKTGVARSGRSILIVGVPPSGGQPFRPRIQPSPGRFASQTLTKPLAKHGKMGGRPGFVRACCRPLATPQRPAMPPTSKQALSRPCTDLAGHSPTTAELQSKRFTLQ